MNEDDLEQLLQRYEPAGPPPSLRARVVAARPDAMRAWPWAVAAAALLALTVWLHDATARVVGRYADLAADASGEDALISMMGDTDEARAIARRIAVMDADARRRARPVATTGAGDER
jgi:hypothetical protein